jgi:phosphatidylglycerophosphate synthase
MPATVAPSPVSRDPGIEDPTNLWLIHPAARALLPAALELRMSANAISVAGFLFGVLAGAAYSRWFDWRFATLGFLLCLGWLICDGLDGMVARATGTASAAGRILDGLCDYGVFIVVQVPIAFAIGTIEAFALGIFSGVAHAFQSSLYEGERARYHRRLQGEPPANVVPPSANPLVRAYDAVATSMDRTAAPLDRHIAQAADRTGLIARYRALAAGPMKAQLPLTANARVVALFLFSLAGDPRWFWWYEITLLSLVAWAGIAWHRRVERRLQEDFRRDS